MMSKPKTKNNILKTQITLECCGQALSDMTSVFLNAFQRFKLGYKHQNLNAPTRLQTQEVKFANKFENDKTFVLTSESR